MAAAKRRSGGKRQAVEHTEAVRQSERFAHAILSSLTAHIAVLDQKGEIVLVNPAWEKFGRENDGAALARCGVGINYLEVCRRADGPFSDEAPQVFDGIAAVLDGSLEVYTMEYPCHSPTQRRWFLLYATPFSAEGGGAVVSHVDITARREAEQALRDSEERMRAIVETATDAIITIGEDGIIQSFNPAAERLFGYTADEAIGQNITLIMPSPHAEEHDGYIARYLKTGEARIIGIGRELIAIRRDGSTFPVDLAVSEVDHRRLFTGMIRDISASRQLQRQILEIAAEEQRRIGQDLHDHTGQELTGLALLAHSLVESLQDRSPADVGLAERITRGIETALDRVRGLAKGLVPVDVHAEGLMEALAELAATTSDISGVHCGLRCDEVVSVDDNEVANHLYRIAQEAITNALKHGRPQHIWVELAAGDNHISLSVRDDGAGLPVDRVFEGLGQRIMKYRARLMGATLVIGPAEQGGTLVSCTLPRIKIDGEMGNET